MGAAVAIVLGLFGVMPWTWVWGAAFTIEAIGNYANMRKLQTAERTVDILTHMTTNIS